MIVWEATEKYLWDTNSKTNFKHKDKFNFCVFASNQLQFKLKTHLRLLNTNRICGKLPDSDSTRRVYSKIPEFKFNKTTNISVTAGRSGSISIPESGSAWKFFPPGSNPTNGTGSYSQKRYEAAEDVENFATHSTFAPYVTTVGLYNDRNQLMAIGKLARAVKNEDDLALSVVVRFDVPS